MPQSESLLKNQQIQQFKEPSRDICMDIGEFCIVLYLGIQKEGLIEGKLFTFLWQFMLMEAAHRISNSIKTRYAQWECAGISLWARDTWDREAEAPKASFHLQIPRGLHPELVVFPSPAKGLTMLSFHERGHTRKGGRYFSIVSEIGYAISSDTG